VIPNLDWGRFEAALFDVDGTLYDQGQLRRIMAFELAMWCLTHPLRFREAKILATFRRLREEHYAREETSIMEAQYQWTADALNVPATEVRRIADEWLLKRPLRHLLNCRPPGLGELFERLRARKIKIGVFSDYPAQEKLAALRLKADAVACALDTSVNRLKPHPAGLQCICEQLRVHPNACLHLGDRLDRDEPCARSCGCESLILSARTAKGLGRERSYDLLFP